MFSNLKARTLLFGILMVPYCLIFGEAFARTIRPTPLMPRYVTGADYGIRRNIPNAEFWQTTPETRAKLQYNSKGMRTPEEYDYENIDEQCRVLLLGDSYFVGFEVNFEDSFAYRLEQNLKEQGYSCEILNLAVSGFGTAESLITLQEEGLKYSPDLVVLEWQRSDLRDNVRSGLFAIDDEGALERKAKTYLPGVKTRDRLGKIPAYLWLIENSQLYVATREVTAKRIQSLLFSLEGLTGKEAKAKTSASVADAEAAVVAEQVSLEEAEELSYPEALSLELLKMAQKIAQDGGASFVLLEVPEPRGSLFFADASDFIPDLLREELNFVNPIESFYDAARPDLKLFFKQGMLHLTPEGNQLLADHFTQDPDVQVIFQEILGNREDTEGSVK